MNPITTSPVTSMFGTAGMLLTLWHMYETKTIDLDALKSMAISAGLVWAKDWNFTGGSRF